MLLMKSRNPAKVAGFRLGQRTGQRVSTKGITRRSPLRWAMR